MKHVEEYRDHAAAARLAGTIAREAREDRSYRLMEFCGGHTHAIYRYGLADLLPKNIVMIHGPGCPVCVLPSGRLDMAIRLAQMPGVILASYGDMMRVPGADGVSLIKARAAGADIRMVYSTADAVQLAAENPDREVVFFAIGFETTTPPTALAVKQAAAAGLQNFSVFVNHVLTPAAMGAILSDPEARLDGIIGPSHVSVVIGSDAYQPVAVRHEKPIVVAGFEPLDVLQSILMLVRALNEGRADVENQYIRAVTPAGNAKAKTLMADVFAPRETFEWRGLGEIANSALRLAPAWQSFDAELRFEIPYRRLAETKSCECPAILRGIKRPEECRLFARACTPETPLGSCMVSAEGACAAHYTYGRFRDGAA